MSEYTQFNCRLLPETVNLIKRLDGFEERYLARQSASQPAPLP
jgi:hypothetical protein